jgi:hypothetical protein
MEFGRMKVEVAKKAKIQGNVAAFEKSNIV